MEGIYKLKYAFISLLISFVCLSGYINERNKCECCIHPMEMFLEQRKYLAIKRWKILQFHILRIVYVSLKTH